MAVELALNINHERSELAAVF